MGIDWVGKVLKAIVENGGPTGAGLAVLVILFFLAAYFKLFPKFTRRTSALITFAIIGIVAFLLVSPTLIRVILRVQTVDIMLVDESGSLVPVDFSLRYRLPDRGVIPVDGSGGIAEARGIPIGDDELNVIEVNAPGWSARDRGRLKIDDGEVRVALVKSEPVPPPDDAQRPDPSVFTPTKEQLAEKPAVKPSDVTLHYANNTGAQLSLILYPYSSGEPSDPWTLKTKWLDFPTDVQANVYDKFKSGNGWFGVWVRDAQKKYWALGLHNLFSASEVWLRIEKSNAGPESPYKLEMQTGDAATKGDK